MLGVSGSDWKHTGLLGAGNKWHHTESDRAHTGIILGGTGVIVGIIILEVTRTILGVNENLEPCWDHSGMILGVTGIIVGITRTIIVVTGNHKAHSESYLSPLWVELGELAQLGSGLFHPRAALDFIAASAPQSLRDTGEAGNMEQTENMAWPRATAQQQFGLLSTGCCPCGPRK